MHVMLRLVTEKLHKQDKTFQIILPIIPFNTISVVITGRISVYQHKLKLILNVFSNTNPWWFS